MTTRISSTLAALALIGCSGQNAPINNIINVDACCGCSDDSGCEDEDDCDDDCNDCEDDTGIDEDDTGIEDTFVDFTESKETSLDLEVNKVDVAFLLDTTCSMSSEAAAMATEFSDIVGDLSTSIDDAAYGFATFDDYNWTDPSSGHNTGSGADRPFILRHQITTVEAPVQTAMDSITIHNGDDGPESSMEALYQGLTGLGFNQAGDGIFDAGTDVLPLIATTDDAFNGTVTGSYDSAVVGSGEIGGFGFRDGSLPVIVYATDNILRDPDGGATITGDGGATYMAAPATANHTAGGSDVVASATDLGARLIGVATESTVPVSQMTDLAIDTNSLYEADSDGVIDDPLVFTWTGSSAAFRDTIVEAIEDMLGNVVFADVTAVVVGNSYGFTTSVSPASYTNVTVGSSPVNLDFTVDISGTVPESTIDQTFPLTLEIYGDGSTLLGTQDVTVVVPATL